MDKTDSNIPPSIEKSLQGMREVLGLWQIEGEWVEIPLKHNSIEAGLCVRSIAEHAIALTDSVLLLAENQMFLQAVPLIRLTLECGITAAWVSITPNAVGGMRYRYAIEEQKLMRQMIKLNVPVPEKVVSLIDARVKSLLHYKASSTTYKERAQSFAGGELLYLPYRRLSKISHAEEGIMNHYLSVNSEFAEPEKRFALMVSPKYEWAEQAFGSQVMSLILILTAWDDLSMGNPWAAKIQDIADRFQVTPTIRKL